MAALSLLRRWLRRADDLREQGRHPDERSDSDGATHAAALPTSEYAAQQQGVAVDATAASVQSQAERARLAGNAALGAGRLDDALTHYQRFVDADPRNASAHVNRAFVLLRMQRVAEAESGFRQARELDLSNLDGAFFLGQCLEKQSRWPEAREQYEQCTLLDRSFEQGWLSLARMHEQLGDKARALDVLRQASHRSAGLPGVLHELARLSLLTRNWALALDAADRCLALGTSDAQLHGMRSEALRRLQKHALALEAAQAGLSMAHDDHRLWQAHGLALLASKQPRQAIDSLERAVNLSPADADALAALSSGYIAADRYDEALHVLDRALAVDPDHGPSQQSKGSALLRMRRFDEGMPLLRRACVQCPDDPSVRFELAVALLALGQWREGWTEYESRLLLPGTGVPAMVDGIPWLQPGQELRDKGVFITVEQGLGDTIQFIRYIPILLDRGARVALNLPTRLRSLLPEPWPGCTVVDPGDRVAVDFHAPLMSLPRLLAVDQPVPMPRPYLAADASRHEFWRLRIERTGLGAAGQEAARRPLRVGLAWAGNPDHPDDARRSLHLEPLRRALQDTADIQYISLQLALPERDVEAAAAWPGLVQVGHEQRDMADTAALIEQLDAVVCVDTSIAHLTGSLSRPFLLLLQYQPDWRWGLDGEQSDWYPSARLIRQPQPGDWDSVLAALRRTLDAWPRPDRHQRGPGGAQR